MLSSKPSDSQIAHSTDGKQDILAAIAAAASIQALVPASVSPYAVWPDVASYPDAARKASLASLDMLPSDVLCEITKWLDLSSIIRLSLVNRRLNRFFQSQLKNQNVNISKTFHALLTEMKSTYTDEYNAAAVELQNENGDLKNGLCSLIACSPSSFSRMSASDYIIFLAYLTTASAYCLLSFTVFVNLLDLILDLISNPDPNVKEDPAKLKERIFDLSFLGIGLAECLMLAAAVACLGVAFYRGVKSCQHRYTLFTSGREIERYDRRISEMEKGRSQVVQSGDALAEDDETVSLLSSPH